ncbi:S-adenosyl-L-methionine-dependent methyltransferase [Halteromyces radiatus]|uniref:S-adenosyl-L-methionine-dependent methyltransferase n=1 Tax=Halteromyces radiatus TaxID=101107 RepID=UPI00221F98CB|nr:S-adenosyl-L-methionine-dependent methyltransferase [Halteromyces radiatus]KAI8076343.1 S-adenosyl-L-methionine-dependent methyltransferase [Halteromyces radiatus]
MTSSENTVSAIHAEDIAFARALHGKEIKTGLISNLKSKNADVHNVATDTYLKMWKKAENETKEDEDQRLDSYTKLVNSYYNLATDFYEYGWGTSFHFCRYYPGEEFFRAIARHEHYLAANTGIKKGMKVLDVGCGVGGPAREIAHFTGAHITGLNNNAYQVERAFHYAAKEGLQNQTNFIKGNFMEMPFEDNSYDAVYAIEATCHAPTFEGVYGEIFRVLKPGGKFGCYEWCMTDDYDASNPKHHEIGHGIERGNGIPKMRPTAECLQALKNVGFEIELHQDMADVGDSIAWYYPLEGDLRKCQTFRDYVTTLAMTRLGRFTTTNMCRVLEKIGLAPKGTVETQKFLEVAADALVAGAQQNLFTPMFFFVVRKPL